MNRARLILSIQVCAAAPIPPPVPSDGTCICPPVPRHKLYRVQGQTPCSAAPAGHLPAHPPEDLTEGGVPCSSTATCSSSAQTPPSAKTQGMRQKRDSESPTHRDLSPPQASANKRTAACFLLQSMVRRWVIAPLNYAQPFVFLCFYFSLFFSL